jgi:hypothetical protein
VLAPGSAAASAYDCYGDTSAGLPTPKRTDKRLLFGIYPGGRAGQIVGGSKQAKPEQPARTLDALAALRQGRPYVSHLYLEFTNAPDQPPREEEAVALVRRYANAGLGVEYVLAYRPRGRRGAADVADFVSFTRRMVARLGAMRGVKAIQVTNEVNNTASPDASDGAYPGARDALVQGVIAAKDEARRSNLAASSRLGRLRADRSQGLEIGFNWFYRLDPQTEQSFWSEIGAKGGRRFVESLDWVGLDAYPETFFPPRGLSRRGAMANAMSVLRECMMPIAGIPKTVPIHVTENGWPTDPSRSYGEQAVAVREMVQAVHDFRANYNVSDYRFFDLRDADSSDPSFQQQYGLMRDDYTPKPAFGVMRSLVAELGRRPGEGTGRRAALPRLRLAVSPRRVRRGRSVRYRLRVTVRRGGRARPVHRAVVHLARRRSVRIRRRATATKTGFGRARIHVRVVSRR